MSICKWTIRVASVITFFSTIIILLIMVNNKSTTTNSGATNVETFSGTIVSVLFALSLITILADLITNRKRSAMIRSYESSLIDIRTSFDPNMKFPFANLNLGNAIGEGEFGKVVIGEAKDLLMPGIRTHVAIKMLKDNYCAIDVRSLQAEVDVMQSVGRHENIVNLLGCSYDNDERLFVIVDYALHGCLKEFLMKQKVKSQNATVLNEFNLVAMAWQVAKGMEFLESKKCIHRDLAARNVLVNGDYILKISDFGLARYLPDSIYYRPPNQGAMPYKWMAPESISTRFYDSRTDVWSFGIVLWEIMTFGDTPYPDILYDKLLDKLTAGYRMPKPENCSPNIYNLMKSCWDFKAENRPTFEKLVRSLESLKRSLPENTRYINM